MTYSLIAMKYRDGVNVDRLVAGEEAEEEEEDLDDFVVVAAVAEVSVSLVVVIGTSTEDGKEDAVAAIYR